MISLLLHKSEAKPRMSVNNKDIIRIYLGFNWLITQDSTNQCFLCEQQAIASGYVHLSMLLFGTNNLLDDIKNL